VYNLKPELAAKVREAILTFQFKGTSLEKEFASSKQDRFIPVDYKSDWQLIRRIDNEIGRQHKINEAEPEESTDEEPATQPVS
jgi:phosphonate transport system substrate-binding protein